ncbi:Uncharacterised protein [Yersinia intermedia]|nr:Uncharacterised protein [Yersinia intermedia]CNH39852.1 Uncharacterised protein [Yersinia intermedia]
MTESIFAALGDVLPADSQSTSRLVLTLKDNADNSVTGLANDIVLEAVIPGTIGTLPTFSAFIPIL